MQNNYLHPIRIAVLADTHNVLLPDVQAILKSCDAAIHAGDVTGEQVMDELRRLTNIYVVRGNNDRDLGYLKKTLRCTIGGVSFLAVHDRRDAGPQISEVQAVIYGHSHRYAHDVIDGRVWLNPGSCGRRRFGGELTMAVITVLEGKILGIEKLTFGKDRV